MKVLITGTAGFIGFHLANKLSAEGKIVIRPVKGGVMLYLPEEAPGGSEASQALKKMGLA